MEKRLRKNQLNKIYRDKNKDKLREKLNLYRSLNREAVNARLKIYRSQPHVKKNTALSDKKRRNKNLKLAREKDSHYNRKRFYGLPREQFEEMLSAQNSLCLICKKPETATFKETGKVKSLAVDHCHKTNKIRGLLCQKCNLGLGYFEDSIESLEKAIDYLEKNHGELFIKET